MRTSVGLLDLAISGLGADRLADLEALKAVDAGASELPAHPVVRRGDVWLCGRHRVACGDSTDTATVARAMGALRPGIMVTDPPYGVEYNPSWRDNAVDTFAVRSAGKVSNDERVNWASAWSLFLGDVAYVWHAGLYATAVYDSLIHVKFTARSQIIWAKQHFVISRGVYHWQHEPCWYAVRDGKSANWCGGHKQSTIWEIKSTSPLGGGGRKDTATGHGTQKPLECMRRPIANHGHGCVYDPFLGSGTTLVAAELEGRVCVGVELSPLYCYVALDRWARTVGHLPTLESTGETLTEVMLRREREPEPQRLNGAAQTVSSVEMASAIVSVPPAAQGVAPAPLLDAAPVRLTPRGARVQVVHAEPRLPESAWRPPAELPQLRGRNIDVLAFDVETKDTDLKMLGPGVRRPGNYVVGFSVAVAGGPRLYVPFQHEGGDNLDEEAVKRWARSELATFEGTIVGANILYDLDWASEWGLDFAAAGGFYDVLAAETLIDEWLGDYKLESVAMRHLGRGKDEVLLRAWAAAAGIKSDDAIKGAIWRAPARYVGPYGEVDADLPLLIRDRQLKAIEAEDLGRVLDVEMGLIPVLHAMRRRGVRVDEARRAEVRDRVVTERDRHLAEMRRLAGPQAEVMAPESFAAALASRGLDVPTTPKSGKPSVTREWLRENREDELVDEIRACRRLEPIINTFLEGIEKYVINGRVHCEFNPTKRENEAGGVKGSIARFSSSRPNLQNQPKRDEELGPLVRSVFLPEEGERWVSLDLSQIEWRFLCHFADGADEARRRYTENPGTDYYRMTMEMAGLDPSDRRMRDAYKAVTLAKGYGAGRPKLIRMMVAQGLAEVEADRTVTEMDRKLPWARDVYRAAQDRARKRGYVMTILGRRQRFPFWSSKGGSGVTRDEARAEEMWGPNRERAWASKALNRVIQGSAADHMKKAMVDYWARGLQRVLGAPLVTVHDELGLSVPPTPEGLEALAEARHIMETCIPLKVPVLCKQEEGPNWGDLS